MVVFSVKKNIIILFLVIVVLLSISINVYQREYNKILLKQSELNTACNRDLGNTNYQLLSPDIAWLSVDDFLTKQQHMTTSYQDMKGNINLILQNAQGQYAFYFEDLTTGAWVGINEKDEFIPLSLLKVPTMIATLKEVEDGNLSLDQYVILSEKDMDNRSGGLWKEGPGYAITVKDLLIKLIKDSDNTAELALVNHVISDEVLLESTSAIGFTESGNVTMVTPKEYANMLRGLYFSNYLRRPFSELALTMMLETNFNSQIPAGIPSTVKVAHKVGFYTWEGYYHDCGIIYAPDKPYILCIMSKGSNAEEADRVISQLSKLVYERVTANNSIIR
jgi:beta-lactamase class A